MQKPSTFIMDAAVEDVLAEYEMRQSEEDLLMTQLTSLELASRRDEFLVCVGRATGTLLNLLVRESHARAILELGTSFGYSTIWLAEAARATGGRVLTVDVMPQKQRYARAALERAGLSDFVEFESTDAIAFLTRTRGIYDFVLLDLWKDSYIPCVNALHEKLQPGATIVADNMLQPPFVRLAAARYQSYMGKLPDFQTIVLPVGSGVAISRYKVEV